MPVSAEGSFRKSGQKNVCDKDNYESRKMTFGESKVRGKQFTKTNKKAEKDDPVNGYIPSKSEELFALSPTHDSTPRRKRGPLYKLQSDLSPKYIGTVAPYRNTINYGHRNLRQRNTPNNPTNIESVKGQYNSFNEDSVPTVRKSLSLSASPLRKQFVSPIDKLLVKNGSTIVLSEIDLTSTSNISNTETKKKSSDLTEMEVQHLNGKTIVNVDENLKKNSTNAVSPKNTDDNLDKDVKLDSIVRKGNELDNIVDCHQSAEQHGERNEMHLNAIETLSAKSPSTMSIDSAKGSSIVDTTCTVFSTGDLFWGQIYSYSYWPCMVCPDPEGKTITTEGSRRSGEQHVLVHVRFFADNGRRNWVKVENLIAYNGLEKYNDRVQDVKDKYGKTSNQYKILVPRKSKLSVWHAAVLEANSIAEVQHNERLEKFYQMYEEARELQRLQRIRRKSMVVLRESTSDLGSVCDSVENIVNKTLVIVPKRERSSSPFSPAFSPVKMIENKKRKISLNTKDLMSTSTGAENPDCINIPSNELFEGSLGVNIIGSEKSEFNKFYAAMKDFVIGQIRDEHLERSLVIAVRNIWGLRELSHNKWQQCLLQTVCESNFGSNVLDSGNGKGSVKRLSHRLKNLSARRSLQEQSINITNAVIESASLQSEKGMQFHEKTKKNVTPPIEAVIDAIFELESKYLFRDLGKGPVCKYCFQASGKLERCTKNCNSWLHVACSNVKSNGNKKKKERRSSTTSVSSVGTPLPLLLVTETTSKITELTHITSESEELTVSAVCRECANGQYKPICCVCERMETDVEKVVVCTMPHCSKAFHPVCCKYWPQAKITKSHNNISSFRCPSHVCHTCVSDDPKGKFQHLSNAKMTKCLKCPATYHTDSTCIPAGSTILTAAYIICPRHWRVKSDAAVNVNWCFICVGGGQLICCETCPTAVHAECLNIPLDPNEAYICEECESGRMPLYGEMVWAKFNNFRWWPAIILPPPEVPQNIMRKAHNAFEFVVRFFGTHDHGWISRRRVYLYLEGDSSAPPRIKSYLDQCYSRGIEEAKRVYHIIKAKKLALSLLNEGKEKLHPQPYVRIKSNRPVPPVKLHIDMEKMNKCECHAEDENPCGPDSNCLNRVLYHECNPKLCPAGERCQNQMFESRVSPQLDVVYTKERGFGLLCREPLVEGSFVIEYVGEIINDAEFKSRLAQKSVDRDENFYFLSVEKDYIIDAGPKGNSARFMNHSCDPNCETQKWSVNGLNRIGLFTVRDIPANTELTFNYHWDELLGSERKTCLCGAGKCAGQIGGKYKESKSKERWETPKKPSVKVAIKNKIKPRKRLGKANNGRSFKVVINAHKSIAKVKGKLIQTGSEENLESRTSNANAKRLF